MITYIGLMNFTDKGIGAIKDSTKRAAAAQEAAARFGVRMREIYWTLGDCDLVGIFEADSEQDIAAFGLAIAAQGNVRARTLRAFTAAEMDAILAKLP